MHLYMKVVECDIKYNKLFQKSNNIIKVDGIGKIGIIEHVSCEKENNDQDDDLSSLSNNIEDEETLVIIINDDAVEDIIMRNGI